MSQLLSLQVVVSFLMFTGSPLSADDLLAGLLPARKCLAESTVPDEISLPNFTDETHFLSIISNTYPPKHAGSAALKIERRRSHMSSLGFSPHDGYF